MRVKGLEQRGSLLYLCSVTLNLLKRSQYPPHGRPIGTMDALGCLCSMAPCVVRLSGLRGVGAVDALAGGAPPLLFAVLLLE